MKLAVVAGALALLLSLLLFWLWTPDRGRAELEAGYLREPGDMQTVGPWRLHLRDAGPKDAPALILLHGFGASLHTWEAWAAGLSDRHRVIRIDLPGNGLSWPDAAGDYSDARTHALLLALMDHLGLARASIAGHSIGGRIAWTFAARHPERVERLVLIAPDGFASPGFEYGRAAEVPASMALMRFMLPRPLLRMSLAPAYANPAVLDDALLTRYHRMMLAPGVRSAMLARMRQTVLVDPRPVLRGIRAPTLLLWGEQDAMIPFANSADYLGVLPDARLVALPQVGHLPQEERAELGFSALRRFLETPALPGAPTPTPSAMTVSFRLRAMAMMATTMADSRRSPVMSTTNARSILRVCNAFDDGVMLQLNRGQVDRHARHVQPLGAPVPGSGGASAAAPPLPRCRRWPYP